MREKAILRRLVEVGQRIAQIGQSGQGELADIVDRAQADVMGVDGSSGANDYRPISELIPFTIDELEVLSQSQGQMHGVPSGFPDLDRITTGFRGGQMIVVAARPGIGKSTLGLDFCRAASIKNNLPSAIFSLENVGQRDHHPTAVGRRSRQRRCHARAARCPTTTGARSVR